MPIDYSLYPSNWKQISADTRERAGNKCERCAVANGAVIFRSECLGYWYDPAEDEIFEYPSGRVIHTQDDPPLKEKPTKIVLTVAHVDHDIQNNTPDNLKAWCQICHLRHDAQQHAQNARRTRIAKYVSINPALDF